MTRQATQTLGVAVPPAVMARGPHTRTRMGAVRLALTARGPHTRTRMGAVRLALTARVRRIHTRTGLQPTTRLDTLATRAIRPTTRRLRCLTILLAVTAAPQRPVLL